MSGLRKAIAAKKAAAAACSTSGPPTVINAEAGRVEAQLSKHTSHDVHVSDSPVSNSTNSLEPNSKPSDGYTDVKKNHTCGIRQGFLNQSAGALYPDGSTEATPPLWRSNMRADKPVFELITFPERYEVVGRFHEAGGYVGKEDFEVARTGNELRIKGNPQGDPNSLVAALDERIKLPLDAEWEGMQAEFAEYQLRVRFPRAAQLASLFSVLEQHLSQAELTDLYEKLEHSGSPEMSAQFLSEAVAKVHKLATVDEERDVQTASEPISLHASINPS